LAADAIRLQLHALAYYLGNFLRTLATAKNSARRRLSLSKSLELDHICPAAAAI
jgi:hypothetical protein